MDKDIVISYCSSIVVDDKDNLIGLNKWAFSLNNKRWLTDFTNDGKVEIKQYLRFKNTIPNASAVIFSKKLSILLKKGVIFFIVEIGMFGLNYANMVKLPIRVRN